MWEDCGVTMSAPARRESFAVPSTGWGSAVFLGAFFAILLGALYPALAYPSSRVSLVILVLALVVLGAFAYQAICYALGRVRIVLGDRTLRIDGDMLFGRAVAWDRIERGSARAVDLAREPEMQPTVRLFGIGMPGYRAGWFRLSNGETALMFLTDETQAVTVRTRDAYRLIVSSAATLDLVVAMQRHEPAS